MVTWVLLFLPFGKLECEATCFSQVDYQKKKKERKRVRRPDALSCYVGSSLHPSHEPLLNKTKSGWPLSLKKAGNMPDPDGARWKEVCANQRLRAECRSRSRQMWSSPDYEEWKGISPELRDFFFFLNRGRYCLSESPRLSENRQKSIAHLLRISELVCVECNWVPEHLSEQGLLGRKDNWKDCL